MGAGDNECSTSSQGSRSARKHVRSTAPTFNARAMQPTGRSGILGVEDFADEVRDGRGGPGERRVADLVLHQLPARSPRFLVLIVVIGVT